MTAASHDTAAMTAIVNRLKRADGQLHALIASIARFVMGGSSGWVG